MRRAKPFPSEFISELSMLSGTLKTFKEYRRFQCIWLRVELCLTTEQIAHAVQLHPRSVKRIQARFAKQGIDSIKEGKHGGRYHQNLTIEEEKALLTSFLEKAEAGGILTISEIKEVYEQVVGHPVPRSTIYRILERYNWRKITPRPRHPKADVVAQQAFKKTSDS